MCGILAVLPRVCPCVSDTNRSSIKTAEWIELILGIESFFQHFHAVFYGLEICSSLCCLCHRLRMRSLLILKIR